uniref:Uncharacterized protein n=1 Tax=viral metagenome TaxID=1070528 RepID=A0A6C0IWZ8_9ZZZZ
MKESLSELGPVVLLSETKDTSWTFLSIRSNQIRS